MPINYSLTPDQIFAFFTAFKEWYPGDKVPADGIPEEMRASLVDSDGNVEWRLMKSTLGEKDYQELECEFGVTFPKSFKTWHSTYFFPVGDCSLVRLPHSLPADPLKELRSRLDWYIPEQIIPQHLYPFASEGNDTGVLVFDARKTCMEDEFLYGCMNMTMPMAEISRGSVK